MVAKAEAVIEAYKRVQSSTDVCNENLQRLSQQTWNPPKKGYVKVNIDATTNSEKNLAGLGVVIRDETGHVTVAAIKISKFHGDVSYAKAEAMEWGMQITREAHVKALIVESDSQGVVSLVNNK